MTERRLNMIIEKEYFDAEEVRKANAMNDKTMAPLRRIRLATTDSNKYYAKAVFVANKVIPEEYEESDMLMHYDELSIQANKLLFLESRDE